jgi:hypothetical protein
MGKGVAMLSSLGQREEALKASQEAVAIRRELVAKKPRYLPARSGDVAVPRGQSLFRPWAAGRGAEGERGRGCDSTGTGREETVNRGLPWTLGTGGLIDHG